jgi:hypothetical protein
MKKLCKFLGSALLSVTSLIAIVGPASLNTIAVEELPQSIKNKR